MALMDSNGFIVWVCWDVFLSKEVGSSWDGFDNKVVATLLCHIYDVSKI